MTQGKCWCNEENAVTILKDQKKDRVFALDGEKAMLRIRISPEQGTVGLPIDYCPYCGRQLANGEPRCPEGLRGGVA